MNNNYTKLPRLYIDQPFQDGGALLLEAAPAHYLRSVLRQQAGDYIRVFNGRNGEWIAEIKALGKKNGEAALQEQIKEQPSKRPGLHLYFAPIKKQRMDFLIEKAVELGVTELHPVLTRRTEMRKINQERMNAQIIEAAEQCERLDIPALRPLIKLHSLRPSPDIPLYACIERMDVVDDAASEARKFLALSKSLKPGAAGFLIGPEGGFDDDEVTWLKAQKALTPVSLGEHILRAETAAISCLSLCMFKNT